MKSTIVHLHNDQLKKCIEIFNYEHASTCQIISVSLGFLYNNTIPPKI